MIAGSYGPSWSCGRGGLPSHGSRRGQDGPACRRSWSRARTSCRETIAAGGKRLRPLLVFLAAGVPAPETDGHVRAAVAVELVHGATLVHDDVLDRAVLRRGRPTVVAAGGRRAATATGDLLFSRAFAELAGSGSVPAIRILARASSELAAGELMQREDAWSAEVTVPRYLERCRLKTAVLFRAACELGALEGGGEVRSLGSFGEQIGLASRSWTTCWTSPVRRSAPASPGVPTCSTARSRFR